MQKQDLGKLQLRKLKAFKKKLDNPDDNKPENKKAKLDNIDE